jgi:coronin-1B/1C/6
MASASFDSSIHVWNIINGAKIWDFTAGENILSLEWNHNGSLLGVTTKDKLVQVFDPRSTEETSRLSVQAHEGIKTHKMTWLNNETLCTTGFSKTNERQVRIWDSRNFTKE